jgi:hypothetical protein
MSESGELFDQMAAALAARYPRSDSRQLCSVLGWLAQYKPNEAAEFLAYTTRSTSGQVTDEG